MRRFLHLFLFALALLAGNVSEAQLIPPLQPEQDACDALILCGNSFTSPYSYQGTGAVADLTNTPCSGGEGNSMWIRLNVSTGGIIVFTISPLNLTDDYDFAVLDITNTTCSSLSISNVIRCNFNNNWPGSNVNGVIGLNTTSTSTTTTAGATGGSFLQQITANAGDVYLIMINNFGDPFVGGPSSGFTIDFTGTTATFNGTNPTISAVIPSCNNGQQITLQMSENILCSSIASDGSDFTVSGGSIASVSGINCTGLNGYTDKIVINFASPLPSGTQTLTAQTGTDGNTLLNLCNHPLLLPASIQFVVPPYTAPAFVAIDTPACSEIRIKMATRIQCDSIASDGSDFSISGPQAANVIAAYGIGCDTANFTDTVVLLLQNPLQTDGLYTITAQKGSDGNTQMDSCGLHQATGDAITMNIYSYDGQLVAANDSVLCSAQYIVLDAQNNSTLPFAAMNCDNTPTTCSGNYSVAFAGTNDSLSTVNSPFGSAAGQRAQYLFLASELRAMGLKPGSIRTLEWKVTQKLSTLPYNNFTIKIGCSPVNDLGTSFLVGPQEVYTTPSYNTVTGWNTFNLTIPYNWDGTSNLIVEVCYDNVSTNFNDEMVCSMTPFSSVFRRGGSNIAGCAITTQGTANTVSNLRPRLRFYICEPPVGAASYTWSPGLLLSDSTIHQPLAYIVDDITYHVTAIDKYGCAHRDSMSLILSVRNNNVDPTDTTICLGERVTLEATGGLNYNWIAANPATLSCLNCPSPVATPLETSVYSVVISDQYNCSDTLISTVRVNQLPLVNIAQNDTIVRYGSVIQLTAGGAYYYNWSPPAYLSDPNIVAPWATITTPVTIILSGIDENGCINKDSIRIGVDYSDPVFIPSAFSPNGDGKNDIFKVGSISFQKLLEFRIFNRWGQEIFSTNDPLKGWDGSFRGQIQDAGVYNYVIRLAYPDGKVDTYKGDVTLIK